MAAGQDSIGSLEAAVCGVWLVWKESEERNGKG